MRVIIQRVTEASVTVDKEIISQIGKGVCCFIGIEKNDTVDDATYIKNKILNLRLWTNPETKKPWDKSVKDMEFDILCVSQFTLHAVVKGNKLDFHNAMATTDAQTMYSNILEDLKKEYNASKIKDGLFSAYMDVKLINDGPVTITIDSKKR
ncbi:D-tyrosyl-tRNA(Tyr) deacylase 1 [Strongyloides ratti]|uniref:D-aminoacyl-tRNA deacylase n=1 Tax=Strongyloides ratti TaxID=34506 RepID=A0A090MUH5_STRRB|nr:D-tyrosyl-tRNA(Tyr) deacylase 1 [Strongyloides ratti]CEF62208.1 D-tyrosyl-tRNA(Tyr) deacylase 1 [Strongyloides ratti]